MAEEPDVIREQIEETRESLSDKIEALEVQVKGTIEGVTEAVDQTVGSVKSGITEGVEAVKRTFDLPYQVCQRPWTMLGLAAAAVYLLTALRGRLVRQLSAAKRFEPGRHAMIWDGRDDGGAAVASGVYLLRVEHDGRQQTQRITLLR